MSKEEDLKGPFIRWVNYGYEGWKPESFLDLASMLTTPCHHDFEITKKVELTVEEGGKVKVSW